MWVVLLILFVASETTQGLATLFGSTSVFGDVAATFITTAAYVIALHRLQHRPLSEAVLGITLMAGNGVIYMAFDGKNGFLLPNSLSWVHPVSAITFFGVSLLVALVATLHFLYPQSVSKQ